MQGPLVFTVPDDSPLTLRPGDGFVVLLNPVSADVKVATTSSDGHDSTSLAGWSIQDRFFWDSPGVGWIEASNLDAIRIIISGTDTDLTGTDLVVAEGATGSYTVALATEPSASVTVTISGQAGTDVSLDPRSLTFTTADWRVGQIVAVTAAQDLDAADDEVTLRHTTATVDDDYVGVSLDMSVTVDDDDPAGLVASTVLVGNRGQSGNQSATYSGDHAQAFTTGDNPGGYGVGSVTIISKDPENDPIDLKICEVDEGGVPTDVCLGLTAPDSFVQGPLVFTVPDSSPLTLARDTTYVVVFKAPAEGTVRVDATSSDGEDYFSLPGWSIRNRFQWKALSGWANASRDNAIRIIIRGAGMDLTDTELVVAEGATGTYTVALATEPSASVTVTVSGQAGTDVSLSGLTSNRLTFTTGNWAVGQIVTVTAAQDPDAADDEVTLTHTTASADTDYAELSLDMSVTVDDDDTAGLVVSPFLVGNSGQSGNESVILNRDHAQAFYTGNNPGGYGVGSVTIISEDLENDPIDLKICYATDDPTTHCWSLTPPDSFVQGPLVFTVPDSSLLRLAPEDVYVVLLRPGSADVKLAATSSAGEDATTLAGWSIQDKFFVDSPDDGWTETSRLTAIRFMISGTDTEMDMAEGATGTYTVALVTVPTTDVTVTVSGQAGTDVSLSSNQLTFTTGNWDTSQTVTVTAAVDLDVADDEVTLTLTSASTHADYEGLSLDMVVTVDERAGLVVARTGLSLLEGPVLVGNSGQSGNRSVIYSSDHGQAFTTGNNPDGYGVGSVTIISEDPNDDPIDLKICEVDGEGAPTVVCTELTPPDSFVKGPLVFTVPEDAMLALAPGTTYMVVFKTPVSAQVKVAATNNDGEDSSSLPGWSIRNRFQWNDPNAGWQDAAHDTAIRIIISGALAELVVAEGATGTYTVALGAEPSASVTVTVSGQAGTDVSLSGLSSNQLTFTTGNWDTSQTVTVTAAQDPDLADDEVTLMHTTASAGTVYAGLSLDMSVTVDDDDTAGLVVARTGLSLLGESVLVSNIDQSGPDRSATYDDDHGQAFTTGNNPDGYTVSSVTIISKDPQNDPIDLKICGVDGDGAPTGDCTEFTAPDSSLQGPLVFTVPDSSPLTLAPDTTYMVVFEAPNSGELRVAATTSSGEDFSSLPGWSIRDVFQWNDPDADWEDGSGGRVIRIRISSAVAELVVAEGATGTYRAALAAEPSANVTVTVSGQAGTDVSLSGLTSNRLTFTTGNWAVGQNVTVTAAQDLDAADEAVTLTHTAASADTNYVGVSKDIVVTVDDDETEVDLVSNRAQPNNASATYSSDHGQVFTAGEDARNYTVTSVTIISEDLENDPITLSICEVNVVGPPVPTVVCTPLTPPDSFAMGPLVFTVPDNRLPLTLRHQRRYMVRFKGPNSGTVQVAATTSNGEDGTSWGIQDRFVWYDPNAGSWKFSSGNRAIRIIVSGVANPHTVPVFPYTGLTSIFGAVSQARVNRSVVVDRRVGGVATVITATDADGDTLTYSVAATAEADGAAQLAAFNRDFVLDSGTGQISVRRRDQGAQTVYKVLYQVSDGENYSGDVQAAATADDTLTLTLTVLSVDKRLALGMPVTVTGKTSGDAFSVVDGVADTYVEVNNSWEVVVDLGDAFELTSFVVAPHGGVSMPPTSAYGRLDSSDNWRYIGALPAGGGTKQITLVHKPGPLRYVRVIPQDASDPPTRIAEVEVWGFESTSLSDFDPVLSGNLSGAGFSSRSGSWSITDNALSSGGGAASVLVADLCSECDLPHEALVEATVRMLVEFPAANPRGDGSSGVNFSVGLEEGAGLRRGVVARLFPWRTFDRRAKQGPLQLGIYCGGGGSGGDDRLERMA